MYVFLHIHTSVRLRPVPLCHPLPTHCPLACPPARWLPAARCLVYMALFYMSLFIQIPCINIFHFVTLNILYYVK